MVDLGTTNVLVADDEPSTRAMVARHLRSIGYKVIEAVDGDEAISLALEHLPDIVVLDVMMPGMSGWEVCRRIRETVSLAHTGVVMLTGIGESLNEITSPLYGADAHLDKPFEFSVLDATIAQTLESRRDRVGRLDGADVEIVQTMGEMDDDESDEPVAQPKRARRIVTSGDTSKNGSKHKRAKKLQPEPDNSENDVEDYDFGMDDDATDVFEPSEVAAPSKSKQAAKGKTATGVAKAEKAPKKTSKKEQVIALEPDDEPDQHSKVEVVPQAAKRQRAAKTAKAAKKASIRAVPATKKAGKQTQAEKPAAKSKPAKAKKQAKAAKKAAPKKKAAKTKPAAKKATAKAAKAKKQTKAVKKAAPKKKAAKTKPIVKKSSAKKASPKKAPKRVAPKAAKATAKAAKKRAKK